MSETPSNSDKLMTHSYDGPKITELKGQPLPKCYMVSGELGSGKTMKICCEPGWKWSECIKPIVGGEWCMASHMGYVVSGDMTVVLKDGTKIEAKAGDSYSVPSGHDAWTENGVQAVEFQSGWSA